MDPALWRSRLLGMPKGGVTGTADQRAWAFTQTHRPLHTHTHTRPVCTGIDTRVRTYTYTCKYPTHLIPTHHQHTRPSWIHPQVTHTNSLPVTRTHKCNTLREVETSSWTPSSHSVPSDTPAFSSLPGPSQSHPPLPNVPTDAKAAHGTRVYTSPHRHACRHIGTHTHIHRHTYTHLSTKGLTSTNTQ